MFATSYLWIIADSRHRKYTGPRTKDLLQMIGTEDIDDGVFPQDYIGQYASQ